MPTIKTNRWDFLSKLADNGYPNHALAAVALMLLVPIVGGIMMLIVRAMLRS